jgi:hypothetical protein
VIVELSRSGDPPLRVEIRRTSGQAFRTVKGLGLSPVLEVADWSTVPAAPREAFEALARCVERHAEPFPLGASPPPPSPPAASAVAPPQAPLPAPPAAPLPWRLLLGLALGLAACVRRPSGRGARELLLALVGLPCASGLLWWCLYPRGFLHPNGQGPLWIQAALDAGSQESFAYGPGFPELFGRLVAAFPAAPERAIYAGNTALCALMSPAVWWVARRSGRPAWQAWALALGVALLPVLGREAQSQSYYASCAALLAIGAALLVAGPRQPGSARSWARVALATVGAGLVVAQAARVHPLCWMAAAATPFVLLARPGRPRTTLLRLGVGFVGLGAVVGLSSGGSLGWVLTEGIGAQWGAQGQEQLAARLGVPIALGAAAVLALGVLRSRRGGALLVGAAILFVLAGPQLIHADPPLYHRGFELLFLGALLGPALALLAAGIRERIAMTTLIGAAALWSAWSAWPEARTLRTDAAEQEAFVLLRSRLPEGASLRYLSRAGKRVFVLPLYGDSGTPQLLIYPLRAGTPWQGTDEREAYYYRSSLCDTDEGQADCVALEARWRQTPIAQDSFDAGPRGERYGYLHDRVEVGLFRVEGPALFP